MSNYFENVYSRSRKDTLQNTMFSQMYAWIAVKYWTRGCTRCWSCRIMISLQLINKNRKFLLNKLVCINSYKPSINSWIELPLTSFLVCSFQIPQAYVLFPKSLLTLRKWRLPAKYNEIYESLWQQLKRLHFNDLSKDWINVVNSINRLSFI